MSGRGDFAVIQQFGFLRMKNPQRLIERGTKNEEEEE